MRDAMLGETRSTSATGIKGVALAVAALGLLPLAPVPALGQAQLEEVLVTATRRGETDIQITPISVTALDD